MGTFAPSTHLPSCMCSAAPRCMSHRRKEKITPNSFIFVFPMRLGNLKKNRIRSQLTHPGGKKSSGPPIVRASPFSIPSTSTAKGNQSLLSVLCSLSVVLGTQLPLQSHHTSNIDVLHSFCSVCASRSGQRTYFKTAPKAAETF